MTAKIVFIQLYLKEIKQQKLIRTTKSSRFKKTDDAAHLHWSEG